MMGKNAIFTNITDLKADDVIDLYRKRNMIEHCFRIISMRDLMSPIYHWTPQKIKVHMFFSHLAYLFLALIYNRASNVSGTVSLSSVMDTLGQVRLQYIINSKDVRRKIDSGNKEAIRIAQELNLISVS